MRKFLIVFSSVIFVILLVVNVQAGQPFGSPRHWIAPPNSMAFGMSLDEWMEAWVRWAEDGEDPDARIGNVAFLPILPGPEFLVEVRVGTAIVLPVALWLGWDVNDTLPDDWFGHTDHVWGTLQLDQGPTVEINKDYYVGSTLLLPPAFLYNYDNYLYQALACVILPLPVGVHEVALYSEFVDFGAVFDNTWTITVVHGK
jgi:hypothetical protein